jgi:hypothetical protein
VVFDLVRCDGDGLEIVVVVPAWTSNRLDDDGENTEGVGVAERYGQTFLDREQAYQC